MKTSQTATSFVSVVVSFLASQHHNLHMLILMFIGGSTHMMETMFLLRRVMIVMTLLTVVWSIYRLYKHRCKEKWVIGMTGISAVVSILFVVKTFVEIGW
jgi:hypothetical protein